MSYRYTEEDQRIMKDIYNHTVIDAGTSIVSRLSDQDFMAKLLAIGQGSDSDFEDQLFELILNLKWMLEVAGIDTSGLTTELIASRSYVRTASGFRLASDPPKPGP